MLTRKEASETCEASGAAVGGTAFEGGAPAGGTLELHPESSNRPSNSAIRGADIAREDTPALARKQ